MFEYIKKILKLASPLILGNLGLVLIGVGDVFVGARHSTDTLAAVAIGNSIIMNIFMLGITLLSAISPLLSNFRGEGISIKKFFLPTLEFAIAMAVLICTLAIMTIPLVDFLGFEEHLIPQIKKYMFVCAFSNFGVYLFVALKEFLQAFEIVLFPNLLNVFCVFLNLYLNFVFVFGWYGLNPMGAVGLALATVVSRTIIGIILLLYCLKHMKLQIYQDFSYFKKIIKMGLPISGAVILEFLCWNAITIFAAQLSSINAAVQSILNTLSHATFMVPMAIANAMSVKVGFANGAKNFKELKNYAYSGIIICVIFMSVCASIFLIFPEYCIGFFSKDTTLLKIAVPLLMLMGLFQVFDGIQVSIGGVFKGLKNTKIIMFSTFIAYYIIGLPLGCLLAFKFNMNLFGFWIGLTFAIATLGTVLFIAMKKIFRKYN